MNNLLYKITETKNVLINSLVGLFLALIITGVFTLVINIAFNSLNYSFNI